MIQLPPTTLADKIILLLALGFLSWLYWTYWFKTSHNQAEYAIISSPYQTKRVELHIPQHLLIQGRLGNSRVEIQSGKIRFTHSPCRNKYCIHSGWLTTSGEFAACLPNQVSIQLYDHQGNLLDAVSY